MTSPASARQEAEATTLEMPVAESQGGQARARESVPIALPIVHHEATDDDSPSPLRQAQDRAVAVIAYLRALFAVPARPLHHQPKSVVQTAAHHKEAAGHWEAGIIRWPRHMYGWGHTLLSAVMDVLKWVTEEPARAVIAVGILLACHFWLPIPYLWL
jgi:hypothetical protein